MSRQDKTEIPDESVRRFSLQWYDWLFFVLALIAARAKLSESGQISDLIEPIINVGSLWVLVRSIIWLTGGKRAENLVRGAPGIASVIAIYVGIVDAAPIGKTGSAWPGVITGLLFWILAYFIWFRRSRIAIALTAVLLVTTTIAVIASGAFPWLLLLPLMLMIVVLVQAFRVLRPPAA